MVTRSSAPIVEAEKISRLVLLRRWVFTSILWTLAISVGLVSLPDAMVFGQGNLDPFKEFVDQQTESEVSRTDRLFSEGKFADAIALAKIIDANLSAYSVEEKWSLLIIKSHLATGDYGEALQAFDASLKRFKNSIRHRWIGIEVCQFNHDVERAAKLSTEIAELVSRNARQYRDLPNQIVLGKYFIARQADAKEVLDAFYNPTKKRYPNDPEIFRAIAELAIEKHDYELARENFAAVLELSPQDTDALHGIAESFEGSNSEKAHEAIESALAINPNHVESLLLIADQHISSERYAEAEAVLKKVLNVNPKHPIAWAYRAAMAHLANDPEKESEHRRRALADWPGNPNVDHVIGRELSEKYRFQEGEAYQRRSIEIDKDFLPAKIQLAHDLLRLGQELEGWMLACLPTRLGS